MRTPRTGSGSFAATRALPLALGLWSSGCITGNAGGGGPGMDASVSTTDAEVAQPSFGGGSAMIAACGYTFATRNGAEAPQPGKAVLGDKPEPFRVHLGFAGDPSRSMAVAWRTPDEATLASTVQYGKNGALDQSVDGYTFQYRTPPRPNVRMHEVHLCGLEPNTEYSYRVGGKGEGGREAWSATKTFRTAPDPKGPDEELVIAVLGDSREGMDVFAQAVAQAAMATPDLVLFNGDAVSLGFFQSEWDTWFDKAQPLAERVPIISAHGNHDANAVNFYAQFVQPGDEENFSFDFGPVHVVVMNDTPMSPGDIPGRTAQFLSEDLRKATAPWKIAMHHKPAFSASTNHGSDTNIRAAWQPAFDQFKVDFVFNGHDHDYERTKPMRGMTPGATAADGTTYVVTGTTGAPLYGNGTQFFTEVSEKAYSLALLTVRKGSIKYKAIRTDGSALDEMPLITK